MSRILSTGGLYPPGRHSREDTTPGQTPPRQIPPWPDIPPWADPLPRQTPPGQTHPLARPPLGQTPTGQIRPIRRLQRTVRILLECIHICKVISPFIVSIHFLKTGAIELYKVDVDENNEKSLACLAHTCEHDDIVTTLSINSSRDTAVTGSHDNR